MVLASVHLEKVVGLLPILVDLGRASLYPRRPLDALFVDVSLTPGTWEVRVLLVRDVVKKLF